MRKSLWALTAALITVSSSGPALLAHAPATPVAGLEVSSEIPPLVWELNEAALTDGTVAVPDVTARYTVQFLSDGTLAGTADCNSIGGEYHFDATRLTVGKLSTTLVGCPSGSLGTQFTVWLSRVTHYTLTNDALVLVLDDGGTLRFTPSLLGVVWEWRQFAGGDDSIVTASDPMRYTLRFASLTSVQVRADCNRGSGTVGIAAPRLTFRAVAMTRMACPAGSQADTFLSYLEDAASYVIVDGQLALALKLDAGIVTFTPRAESAATPTAGTPVSE